MDATRFDRLTRSFVAPVSRRTMLAGPSLAMLSIPHAILAKQRKKRKVKRNAFGCVNVGKFCKHDGQCCSGICQGKKGKQTCKAHDASTCQGEDACNGDIVNCLTTAGETGACTLTTGNAFYCDSAAVCFDCATDAECVPICGEGAACLVCAECATMELVTACAGLGAEGCILV